jgi:predicted CXXCH cytochrome family protein
MQPRSIAIFVFLCILVATTGDGAPARPATPVHPAVATVQFIRVAGAPAADSTTAPLSKPNASANKPSGKDVCLECHGPFDKLAASSITFAAENGDKINPHRYVPHNRREAKGIVDCTKCHNPHPVPLVSKAGLTKPNADWCYSCHHTHDFARCQTCHR